MKTLKWQPLSSKSALITLTRALLCYRRVTLYLLFVPLLGLLAVWLGQPLYYGAVIVLEWPIRQLRSPTLCYLGNQQLWYQNQCWTLGEGGYLLAWWLVVDIYQLQGNKKRHNTVVLWRDELSDWQYRRWAARVNARRQGLKW